MYINQLKLWVPAKNIVIPPKLNDGKNISYIFFGENTNFFEVYNRLGIKITQMKYFYVPTIGAPVRSLLTQEYRKEILSHMLRPIQDKYNEYKSIKEKNFFYDFSRYLSLLDLKFKMNK